jgi:Asp-tRNA(Asn)/Glu-tRNA(Gln) amidotransferase A subunit family amidase
VTLDALAAAVRSGQVSAVELVQRSLDRIAALDPPINAVVALRGEALAEAASVDAAGAHGPLAGLPLLVKDTQDTVGMRTTHGSVLHAADAPATVDSLVVARLRAAGAIVVGKTNSPEFAFEGFTHNVLFGATGNPWAPAWSTGGSSGGSAAAIAAGMAPLATATDGGGSVRIPAAFCGIAGLKPTNGMIGRSPIPSWIDLSTSGPLATSISDLRLLLDVMRGPVAGDPTALPAWEPRAGIRPSRALVVPRLGPGGELPSGIRTSFETSLERFAAATGLRPEPADLGPLLVAGDPNDDWVTLCAVEQLHVFGRERLATDGDRLSPAFRSTMELASRISLDEYLDARRRRFEYVRVFDELVGADAVVLSPTMCIEGFLADGSSAGEETTSESYNTTLANITGHPALSVPAGLSANGIPFGLQITGPRFADDLVLAVGGQWEAAQPWPPVAPGYEPFG